MSTDARLSFGEALKQHRLARHLTQEALAERAAMSRRSLQALEAGTNKPYRDTAARLAAALALEAAERAAFLATAAPAPRRPSEAPPGPAEPGGVTSLAGEALVPLVGRQRELALLAQLLEGAPARGRAAPLLVLAGEPGIGKTRLLQAAAQQAVARGWCVLEGGCYRRGGQAPYAPLLDALAQYLRLQRPERRGAELAGCAWLGRLLPELAPLLEPLPAGALAPEQEQRLMYAAVARFLANVAGPAGTLLVLDDLQWAGPDALDLLTALVRTPAPTFRESGLGGAGVLRIVGGYRDTEVRPDDPLGLLLADLAQAGLVRHHALGPLASAEAQELLADLLGGPAAGAAGERATLARVLERAGGTPFYLVSYAQALRAAGADEAAGGDGVPWDVAQGVRQRVALLPPTAQELLGAAALVGRRAPWALLMSGSGQPEDVVLAGLEAAGQARLLLEEEGGAYTFAHDVIREVVEADLGTARRAVLHRRVAEALERAPAGVPAELLAYHYARSGVPEKAASYLEQAGAHAWSQRAYGAAERHYRELLERLEALGRAQDALPVREKLGEVLYQAGRYDAALAVLEPTVAALRAAGDGERLGRIALRIGWAHAARGTHREGLTLLQPLLAGLEESADSPAPAGLYAACATLLVYDGHYEAGLAANERASALARAGGDDRLRALADVSRISHLQVLGRLGEALRVGQELLPLLAALDDPENRLVAHANVAVIHAMQGSFALGRQVAERGLAAAAALGEGPRACLLAVRGWLAYLSGEWRGAQADLDQAVALSRQVAPSSWSAYPLIYQAPLALAEDDRAAAAAGLQEALALAEGHGDLQAQRWATGVLAEIDLVEGRAQAATARLLPLLDRPGLEECDVTTLLPVLAWAYLEQGQLEQATATVEQALARAWREERRPVRAEALRVQALIALRQEPWLDRDGPRAVGDQSPWEEAMRSLEEGLALARAMPYPYAEARLLHVAGQLHAQQGESALARERLEASLAIFRRLGARRDAAQVDQALAGLFQNPPPCERRSAPPFATRVTDAQWAAIAALLAPGARTGRPRADDRRTLEAILYKLDTGCGWQAIPPALGAGVTAYRRLRAWQAAGVWEAMRALMPREPA